MRNNTLDPIEKCKSDTAFAKGEVTTHSAEQAFNQVLKYGGCSLKRDAVDTRIANEAETGTTTYKGSKSGYKGIIDTPADVGGWPEYKGGERLADADDDGMPDIWETANGLDPNDASDAQKFTIDKKGWYTNIEVYCNWLVEDIMKAGNQNAQENIPEYYPEVVSVDLDPTVIQQALPSNPTRIFYYNAMGREVDANHRGLTIKHIIYPNGQTKTYKYMNH